MDTSFVPLRLRSSYTHFGGTVPARELPGLARRLGFGAAALVDRGNLYGALDFYEAAREEGIKPILGAEITCPATGSAASLLALDREGYGGLCRILTGLNLGRTDSLAEAVKEAPDGLAALSTDLDTAGILARVLGRKRVWVEIVPNLPHPLSVRERIRRARDRHLRAVAAWEVLNRSRGEAETSRVLRAIGRDALFAGTRPEASMATLDDSAELERIFKGEPGLLAESHRIAELAGLELDLGRPHFPRATDSPGESLRRLERMCLRALPARFGKRHDSAARRLKHELEVIGRLGLADYFLVVSDITGFARSSGIPVTGRGSGAGSLVSYLLDITPVDPIAHGLLFERFLNEHRPDYPDLDIDLSWKRRDEVIEFAYDHFGRDRVAMISTRACFELRSAAREVAKAFGLSPYEAQSLAGGLSRRGDPDAAARMIRVLGEIRPELPPRTRETIARLSVSLLGLPHHSSVHCGGIVIADTSITDYTPLELAAKGIQVTQFDMHAVERVGLVKIDLLGNRALTVVEETLAEVKNRRPEAAAPRDNDPRTAALISRGRTLSCFQLESPAMRNLLAMLGARNRDEATLALALVRPGPSAGGMKEEYVRRKRSGAANDPGNGGLPIYEEDVMTIISRATGMSLAEADILRRQLKNGGVEDKSLECRFMYLAETAGLGHARAVRIWEKVRRFAAYSFCKAHAASYGVLAYSAAYLKANFPLEFYAATLRNHSGMYPRWVHVNEARRLGIKVLLPDVNLSGTDFAVEGRSIRTGLGSVKHLSGPTMQRIIAERGRGEFASLSDFLVRVPATSEEMNSLIRAGAFEEIEPDRCGALAEYLALKGGASMAAEPRLGFPEGGLRLPTRAFAPLQKRKLEYEALDFSPLVHPTEFFERPFHERLRERPATCRAGVLAAIRRYRSGRADLYFLTLDSTRGLTECVLPRENLRMRLELGRAYVAKGRVRRRFGVATLHVRAIEGLQAKPL
jgi:DNA-directed DNA polymerase III PolC